MPWARASAQVIRPLPLSSYIARASASGASVGVGVAAVVVDAPCARKTIAFDSQPGQDSVNGLGFGPVDGQ